MNKRQIIAATAAGIFTFGSAVAAIALNVGAASSSDSSPAGKLAATEQVGASTSVTPSTIYVDVTVPDLPPVDVPAAASGSSGSGSSGSGSSGSTAGRNGEVDDHSSDDDSKADHDDDERSEDHDSDDHDSESHPGGDDDD